MAKNFYQNGPLKRFTGTAGAAIVAGDMLVRSSAKWVPATDGQQAEGVAITGASGDTVKFELTAEEGILCVFTGTLAANDVAYIAAVQSVDAGSQGNKHCGHSIGLCPWDAAKCVIKMHFKDAETITHG